MNRPLLALAALLAINTNAFTHAIGDGEHELDGWTQMLLLGCAAVLLLILAGIWPRLAEYRQGREDVSDPAR